MKVNKFNEKKDKGKEYFLAIWNVPSLDWENKYYIFESENEMEKFIRYQLDKYIEDRDFKDWNIWDILYSHKEDNYSEGNYWEVSHAILIKPDEMEPYKSFIMEKDAEKYNL